MTDRLDRRTFLRLGAVSTAGAALAGAGGFSALLAACGSSKKAASSTATTAAGGGASTSVAPANLGTLDFQLSWIKNVEFAGEYIADTNGYYTAGRASAASTCMAGGPNVQQDAVVASGKAFVGISSPDITAAAILQGRRPHHHRGPVPEEPVRIMSLASKPIHNPQDMIGKKIGVQSTNDVGVEGVPQGQQHPCRARSPTVPVQFDPTRLVTGEVDGWFSFITNEPNLLQGQGPSTPRLPAQRLQLPAGVGDLHGAQEPSLTEPSGTKLKALLMAEIMGWQRHRSRTRRRAPPWPSPSTARARS